MAKINKELPIVQRIDKVVSMICSNKVTILGAETGAGKTTIVPFALWNSVEGNIVVTGPRRLGVQMCAEYVKELAGLDDDDSSIAFQHKVENCRTRDTKLGYVTEGILLQELREDPTLSKYKYIIVDEVHERSINVDMLLVFLRLAVQVRSDLHLVIMSATLDIESYAKYLSTSATMSIPGRQYPVTVSYEQEGFRLDNDLYKAMADRIFQVAQSDVEGDILAFLPDEVSISKVKTYLKQRGYVGFQVFPLMSAQSKEERNAALGPCMVRKVILATNVAETSVTLEGVVFVIDSCRIKQDYYIDAYMGGLSVTMHSRAGLEQRRGRAGRVRPGYCHRMITEKEYDRLAPFTEPQILRVPKADVLLSLFERGFTFADVLRMEWLTPPKAEQLEEARQLLRSFKYVTSEDVVTERGKKILDLRIAPLFGLFIIAGEVSECLVEMLLFVAALQQQNSPFMNVTKFENGDVINANRSSLISQSSDFLTFYAFFRVYVTCEDRYQRNEFGKKYGVNLKVMEEIHRDWDDLCSRMQQAGVPMSSAEQHEDPLDQLSFALLAALKHHLIVDEGSHFYTGDIQTGDTNLISIFPGSFLKTKRNDILVYAYERRTTRLFAHWCHIIPVELIEETAVNYMRTVVVPEQRSIDLERYVHGVLVRAHTYTSLDEETPQEVCNQLFYVYRKNVATYNDTSVTRVDYLLSQIKQDENLRTELLSRIAAVFPYGDFDVICREVSRDALHGVIDMFCDELRGKLQHDSRFVEFQRLVVIARDFVTSYGHFVSTMKLKEYCELDVVTLPEAERVTNELTRELSKARAKLPSYEDIEMYRAQTHVRDQQGMVRLRALVVLCPFCESSLEFHEKTNAYECRNVTHHHPLMLGGIVRQDIRHIDYYYPELDTLCTSAILQEDGVYRVSVPRQFLSTAIEERIVTPLLCNDMRRIMEIASLLAEYHKVIAAEQEFALRQKLGCRVLAFGSNSQGLYALEDPTITMVPLTRPEGFALGKHYLCELYTNTSRRGGKLVRRCYTIPDTTAIESIRNRFNTQYPEFVFLLHR